MYIVSKYKHTFHAICLVMHRLQHMRQNFLHRLVQEHRTMLEHTTTCCENAHVFFAVLDTPSTIFAFLRVLNRSFHGNLCRTGTADTVVCGDYRVFL